VPKLREGIRFSEVSFCLVVGPEEDSLDVSATQGASRSESGSDMRPAKDLSVGRYNPLPCQQRIDRWPGLEGGIPKPRGFLRSA
jgi:hypothetical protein